MKFVTCTAFVVLSLLGLLSPSSVLLVVEGVPAYQASIPNGKKVTRNGVLWPGAGHYSAMGGGNRNPFGQHFELAGYAWTKSLCMFDSDGDGQTNGFELGDPECVWQPGATPSRVVDISHPGFADSTTTPLPPPPPPISTSSRRQAPGGGARPPRGERPGGSQSGSGAHPHLGGSSGSDSNDRSHSGGSGSDFHPQQRRGGGASESGDASGSQTRQGKWSRGGKGSSHSGSAGSGGDWMSTASGAFPPLRHEDGSGSAPRTKRWGRGKGGASSDSDDSVSSFGAGRGRSDNPWRHQSAGSDSSDSTTSDIPRRNRGKGKGTSSGSTSTDSDGSGWGKGKGKGRSSGSDWSPPGQVKKSLRVRMTFALAVEALQAVQTELAAKLALALGVASSRVLIVSIQPGSSVVTFVVLDEEGTLSEDGVKASLVDASGSGDALASYQPLPSTIDVSTRRQEAGELSGSSDSDASRPRHHRGGSGSDDSSSMGWRRPRWMGSSSGDSSDGSGVRRGRPSHRSGSDSDESDSSGRGPRRGRPFSFSGSDMSSDSGQDIWRRGKWKRGFGSGSSDSSSSLDLSAASDKEAPWKWAEGGNSSLYHISLSFQGVLEDFQAPVMRERKLPAAIARALHLSADQVTVHNISAGSVVVVFEVNTSIPYDDLTSTLIAAMQSSTSELYALNPIASSLSVQPVAAQSGKAAAPSPSASPPSTAARDIGIAIGVVMFVVCTVLLTAAAVLFYKRRQQKRRGLNHADTEAASEFDDMRHARPPPPPSYGDITASGSAKACDKLDISVDTVCLSSPDIEKPTAAVVAPAPAESAGTEEVSHIAVGDIDSAEALGVGDVDLQYSDEEGEGEGDEKPNNSQTADAGAHAEGVSPTVQ